MYRFWVSRSIGRTNSSGTTSQPIRQPVKLKYLEKLLTTMAASQWARAVSHRRLVFEAVIDLVGD